MSGENILSILADLKRATRRCFRGEQPPEGWAPTVGWYEPTQIARDGEEYPGDEGFGAYDADWGRTCPWGAPGDPLAITETWKPVEVYGHDVVIRYRADGAELTRTTPYYQDHEKIAVALEHGRWMAPMSMQTWASRIPAVNTGVKVERVQDISDNAKRGRGWELNPFVWCVSFKRQVPS